MKKMIYLATLLLFHHVVFSATKLPDGIYLIDVSTHYKSATELLNRAVVSFNPAFVEGDLETYEPIVICTDDYVSFDLVSKPIVEKHPAKESMLKVQLSNQAAEQLLTFTSKNLNKQMVVVVNGEALAVYKITRPVKSGIIDVLKCDDPSCKMISRSLQKNGCVQGL